MRPHPKFRPEDEVYSAVPAPCARCGLPTDRVDVCFEAPVHRACQPLLDADWWWAAGMRPVSYRGAVNVLALSAPPCDPWPA